MDIQQVRDLLKRYQTGDCTPSETELVEDWFQQLVELEDWKWEDAEKDKMQNMIESRIMAGIDEAPLQVRPLFISLRRYGWWAAASLILVVASYFLLTTRTATQPAIATVTQEIKAPETNRATLTLANGEKVYLDNSSDNDSIIQGNARLVKLKTGELIYESATEETGELMYNTLSNPRGSQVVNMVLSDGSKVWLNAGSSVTYSVAFVGTERKVAVSGEAYFEVAKDELKPFIVKTDDIEVRVLGTHFNVNGFEDDVPGVQVTLLEGSVKVDKGTTNRLLKPGQQAVVNTDIEVTDDVDLDLVMAWKNGFFQFSNASLQTVMQQISRWYDVDVVYEGVTKPRQFEGGMEKKLNLSQVLTILEKNNVRFKLEGKKLIVIAD